MSKIRLIALTCTLAVLSSLAACGGGSGAGAVATTPPPSSGGGGGNNPDPIQGVALPSNVSVVTATNAN